MYFIAFNFPFRVKLALSFFSLFKFCNCIVKRLKSLIIDFKITASISTCRYFAIGSSPGSSNVRLFSPLLPFFSLDFTIEKAKSLTRDTQHFGAFELLLEQSRISLIVFAVFDATSTGKKLFFASALKLSR